MSEPQLERHKAATASDDGERPAVKPPHGRIGSAGALLGAIGRAAAVHASEFALMASLAASIPLRAVGGGLDAARGSLPPAQPQTALGVRPVLLLLASAARSQVGRWSPEA